MKKLFSSLVLFQFMILTGFAQSITGDWYGIADLSGRQLRITFHISQENPGYSVTWDSPDQEAFGIPSDTLIISGNILNFKYGPLNYDGIISKESQQIKGTWKNPNGSYILNFGRNPIAPPEGSIVSTKQQYNKVEKQIVMRDGVHLFTSIYTPKDQSESYPILIVRTPYNSEPYEESFSHNLDYLYHLLKEKYIIVLQDVRGTYMSEGTYMQVRPYIPNKKKNETDENSDAYDSIDWLVNNVANNNGNVGIFGISYPGFYSTMALPNSHPALKAVSPQAPVSNWFLGDDDHHNGAFFLMDNFTFHGYLGVPRPKPTRDEHAPFNYKNSDNYDFYKDLEPLKNVQKNFFGDSIRFWSDLMKHPNYDEFWKKRDVTQYLTNVKPAVLVVGGWFDAEDLYGALNTYAAIENKNPKNQNRLVMGPWYHGQWSEKNGENLGNIHFDSDTSLYFRNLELQFFNYYLKGKGEMTLPEANIFITGANEWRSFEQWPPENVVKKALYLDCDERLSFEKSTNNDCFDEYMADPNKPVPYTEDVHLYRTREYMTDDQRFASRRPDVMVYETEILEQDITVLGPLEVSLFVTTTGTDADYIVKLIDVFPDENDDYPKNDMKVPMGGYQMLVRGEVMRGKFRNSFENPEPFVPNEITEVSFKIPDIAHQFKKGHRIMIQVQNSWFPLVDINPQSFVNIYEADKKDFIKATHRIYHDSQRPSRISITVLEN